MASLVGGLMVVRGFTPHSVERGQSTTFRLSAGITLVVIAYLARSFYWEITPSVMRGFFPGLWPLWFGWTGTAVNVLFSLVFLRGLYHFLVLLWLLIPLRERGDWSVWSAAFYPDHNIFSGIVGFLRRKPRGRKGRRSQGGRNV
ncbi:hypothetical protein [Roseovarius sp. D0-M9]|uniref:hypothetical protein n=1 Tax=Roseovarius sp. D0-M9 TaxID=3127117 RepID=UPI00300FD79C